MIRRLKKRALKFALGRDGEITPVLISGIRHVAAARDALGPEHGRQWLTSEEAVDLVGRWLDVITELELDLGWHEGVVK